MKGAMPYRPAMPRLWWLQRPGYIRYMLRELTCIFVGAWVVAAIVGPLVVGGALYHQVRRKRQGPPRY